MDKDQDARATGLAGDLVRKAENATGLVWGVARNVTSALEYGRATVASAVDGLGSQTGRLLGSLRDAGGDIASYVDPGTWLEDIYSLLGIATTGTLSEIDDRMDDVAIRVDDVARQKAREELLLLQQRIGEIEALLSGLNEGEAHTAMQAVLGRLAELEARIDALPASDFGEASHL